jgi:hypothetical protein
LTIGLVYLSSEVSEVAFLVAGYLDAGAATDQVCDVKEK